MKKFKRMYIEITNICNLNCEFCPKTTRNPEYMTAGFFKKILNELRNYTEYLYFHVMGEPLLHPDLDVFLDLCYEYGYKVNITTNGMLIKEVKNRILLKPSIRLINFSLHSFDVNAFNSTIDDYLDEIFNFITQSASNPDFIACFRLWNIESNKVNSLERQVYSYRNQYILDKIEEKYNVICRIEDPLKNKYGIKLAKNIYLNQAAPFDWPDIKLRDINKNGFCLGLRNQAAILVDGTVVPCCLDNDGIINLGNINESSFREIIENKRSVGLYNGFSERKVVESLCRKCGYRSRFDLLDN